MMNKNLLAKVKTFTLMGILLGYFLIPHPVSHEIRFEEKGIDEQRAQFISEKEHMIGEMLAHGDYACCLDKPCTYCIEKTPKHGEGATCSCLEDVVTGVHPCGECIGEILEGHGNRFLAKYFATAIVEEVGEEHLETIKMIVSEKYEITLEEQL